MWPEQAAHYIISGVGGWLLLKKEEEKIDGVGYFKILKFYHHKMY